VITLVLFLTLAPEINSRFLDDAPIHVVWLAFAVVPFDVASNTFTSIARGMGRWALQNTYRMSIMVMTLAGVSGVLILAGAGLTAALSVFVLTHAIATAVFLARLVRITGVEFRLNLDEIRDGLRFGLKSYVQTMAGKMHERVDILLLAALLSDPAQVALYAIAVSFVQRLKVIPEALSNVLLPKLASESDQDAASFTSKVSRNSFAWVVVMAIALGIVAPVMIPLLFGAQYRASTPAFLILLPGMVFYTIYRLIARYFVATDRQQANIASEVTSLIANVGLNLWLIPRFGIVGAALASLCSYSLSAIFILVAFRITTGIGVSRMLLLGRQDVVLYQKRLAAVQHKLPWSR
jgi:O-antigen/teichoic acid export membrane protein